jgi:hypothetical protein
MGPREMGRRREGTVGGIARADEETGMRLGVHTKDMRKGAGGSSTVTALGVLTFVARGTGRYGRGASIRALTSACESGLV